MYNSDSEEFGSSVVGLNKALSKADNSEGVGTEDKGGERVRLAKGLQRTKVLTEGVLFIFSKEKMQ